MFSNRDGGAVEAPWPFFVSLPMSADIIGRDIVADRNVETPHISNEAPMRKRKEQQNQAIGPNMQCGSFFDTTPAGNGDPEDQRGPLKKPPNKHVKTAVFTANAALARKPNPLAVISPVLGAAHTNSFDRGNESEAAELSHYLTHTLFTNLFEGQKERRAWFNVFCEYPILFHSFSHGITVHQDVLRNKVSLSIKEGSLRHKGHAMALLKDGLTNLDAANVEVLLIVMVTLATHDLSQDRLHVGSPMGFVPHEPSAYWMDVYGRLDTIPEHLGAIGRLVKLVGGLKRITLPGLANCLALTDIMVAGLNAMSPKFPPLWSPDTSILSSHPKLLSSKGQRPGKGFFTSIPGGLPPHTLSVFIRLATIDRFMSKYCVTRVPDDTYRRMMNTRNAIQHAVLSLPSWGNLPETERALSLSCKESFYEAARLSAVLYSCAVIYALPSHRNWHLRLAHDLRRVIERYSSFAEEAPWLLFWASCVGAMAAFRSPDRVFFEEKLEQLASMYKEELQPFGEAMAMLEDFVWSQKACRPGLASLRVAIEAKRKASECHRSQCGPNG